MMDADVRVTAKQRRAVAALLPSLDDEVVTAVARAVVTAEDVTTRWCVVTQDRHLRVTVFGPYATADAARKAINSGVLASLGGTVGRVLPLTTAPKTPRATRSSVK